MLLEHGTMASRASLFRSKILLVVDINRIFNYCSFSIGHCKNYVSDKRNKKKIPQFNISKPVS